MKWRTVTKRRNVNVDGILCYIYLSVWFILSSIVDSLIDTFQMKMTDANQQGD